MAGADFDPTDYLYDLELMANNFRAENDVFVEKFAQMRGIQEIMELVEVC